MKRVFSILALGAILITSVPLNANAWAINCGCRDMKKAFQAQNGSKQLTQEQAAALADCHGGFVIKICL